MDDLVKRLEATALVRARATAHEDPQNYLLVVARLSHEDACLMAEAAAALSEAQATIARLRDALQTYAEPCDATETTSCGYEGNMCCKTARAALSPREGGA